MLLPDAAAQISLRQDQQWLRVLAAACCVCQQERAILNQQAILVQLGLDLVPTATIAKGFQLMSCINHMMMTVACSNNPSSKHRMFGHNSIQHRTLFRTSLCGSLLQRAPASACKTLHEVLLLQDTTGRPSGSGWYVWRMDNALLLQPSQRAAAQHRSATKRHLLEGLSAGGPDHMPARTGQASPEPLEGTVCSFGA